MNVDQLPIEALEALENELQGVYLDPGYGCPRVEYGSIFRALIAARLAARATQPAERGESAPKATLYVTQEMARDALVQLGRPDTRAEAHAQVIVEFYRDGLLVAAPGVVISRTPQPGREGEE